MKLTGLHFLLSYRCTDECDHCFVWGSPQARGTMTFSQIRDVLHQAHALRTVKTIYFEGGEPFLFYPIMLQGLQEAAKLGFRLGIVSNAYWATSVDDAMVWLRPIAQLGIDDLSLSTDLFHGESMMTDTARYGLEAARRLGLPEAALSIEMPPQCAAPAQIPAGEPKGEPITGGAVRYRGRAATKLTSNAPRQPWTEFDECPYEDLAQPGRLHLDAFGHLHACQGLVIGNLWEQSLREIVEGYDAGAHPVIGALLRGGPAALVEEYALPLVGDYADACHLCYSARDALRSRFPASLAPAQVYGEIH